LRDDQCAAANIEQRTIGLSFVVGKDAQPGDLVREKQRLRLGIRRANANQDNQARLRIKLAHCLRTDDDTPARCPLYDCTHGQLPVAVSLAEDLSAFVDDGDSVLASALAAASACFPLGDAPLLAS
jgi:hypothetical protein